MIPIGQGSMGLCCDKGLCFAKQFNGALQSDSCKSATKMTEQQRKKAGKGRKMNEILRDYRDSDGSTGKARAKIFCNSDISLLDLDWQMKNISQRRSKVLSVAMCS